MYKRILVPLDASPCSQRAFEEALKIAKSSHAFVTAVYVIQHVTEMEDINVAPEDEPLLDPDGLRGAMEALARAQRKLDEQHVKGTTRTIDTWSETVSEVINSAAGESSAELIVMGTHGRHGVQHFLIGSVAESVLRRADVPVLLIRSNKTSVRSQDEA